MLEKIRPALLALAALAGMNCAPALACDDQAGQTIFEDSFPDDTGGWEIFQNGKVEPPEYVLTLPAGWTQDWAFNQTFNATEGDYCMQFRMPAPPAPAGASCRWQTCCRGIPRSQPSGSRCCTARCRPMRRMR